MPTTEGRTVRSVADVIKALTNCTSQQADAAEKAWCSSPDAIATLAVACGISTYAIGMGGRLAVAGIATGGSLSLGGVLLSGAGLLAAKTYCSSLVDNVSGSLRATYNQSDSSD
ncbi:MAG: hypothetical protein NTU44_06365 [Bacteroidetes bacterium]|nr:hypothetical protein [Bacteroidota bacterium]